MEFYVQYQVPPLTGTAVHKKGPWPREQAEIHLKDIAGYEGVENAHLRPVCGIIPCKHPDCAACNAT